MAQSFNTNLFNVAKHYVQALKLKVTQTTLKESLEQNAYYPSLYSLSKVFDKFNLANEAYTVDEESLNRLDPPFITYCNRQSTGKDFVLVTNITGTQVSYIAENNKRKQLSREDFLKQWQKIVFVAKINAESGEKDYNSKLKIEKSKGRKQSVLYAGIVVLIGLMVYWLISNTGTGNIIGAVALIVIKLLGIAATVLLLIYEVDKTNSFVKNICSVNKQTNCDAVLKSKAGKILGVGWGEIGFFYFASTTLFLLLPGLAFIDKLPWLALASSLAAPYIVFSIYYQWKVVKQWCPLCVAVQVVLAMELIWAIVYFFTFKMQNPFTDLNALLYIAGCLLLIMVTWDLLKPVLLAAKASPGYIAAYKRLLYNPEIFNSLLQHQTSAPEGWQDLGIDIGNPNATNTIIKVCNPYCPPCAQAHPVIKEIIEHNTSVKLKIIFNTTNDENDKGSEVLRHFLAIAGKGNSTLTERALDDWYITKEKEYKVFAEKYPMNDELQLQDSKIEAMHNWYLSAEIIGTPTFFINGKKLPSDYHLNELKHIF